MNNINIWYNKCNTLTKVVEVKIKTTIFNKCEQWIVGIALLEPNRILTECKNANILGCCCLLLQK